MNLKSHIHLNASVPESPKGNAIWNSDHSCWEDLPALDLPKLPKSKSSCKMAVSNSSKKGDVIIHCRNELFYKHEQRPALGTYSIEVGTSQGLQKASWEVKPFMVIQTRPGRNITRVVPMWFSRDALARGLVDKGLIFLSRFCKH